MGEIIHIHEGIVLGHARCYMPGCEAPARAEIDPYVLELDDEQVLIDTCEMHLNSRADDI